MELVHMRVSQIGRRDSQDQHASESEEIEPVF